MIRLVAAGRSNQQIADELFITRKTASVHVSNILGKLGAANRVEAAAIAQRLGLGTRPTGSLREPLGPSGRTVIRVPQARRQGGVSMRKLPAMIAGAGLLLVIAAPAVVGDTNRDFKASLNGYLETPSVSTTARGSFSLRIHGASITYRLTFRDLTTPTLFAQSTSRDLTWRVASPPSCAAAGASRPARHPGR